MKGGETRGTPRLTDPGNAIRNHRREVTDKGVCASPEEGRSFYFERGVYFVLLALGKRAGSSDPTKEGGKKKRRFEGLVYRL